MLYEKQSKLEQVGPDVSEFEIIILLIWKYRHEQVLLGEALRCEIRKALKNSVSQFHHAFILVKEGRVNKLPEPACFLTGKCFEKAYQLSFAHAEFFCRKFEIKIMQFGSILSINVSLFVDYDSAVSNACLLGILCLNQRAFGNIRIGGQGS